MSAERLKREVAYTISKFIKNSFAISLNSLYNIFYKVS
ncbi:hypothetical protein [Salmonella phage vB_SenS_SB10]|uniref:Uncharacterized protein n=1 Tax=Salmonella phage vB_SenS_SB10 TaxID=2591134 RepID=A0A5J6TAY6_9CAUD|nr:hypothetical protein [Salmonella phage vB_SenS_SB10]